MLTRLARWLRFAGYDCELAEKSYSDDALLNRARASQRVLLTGAAAPARLYPDEVIYVPPRGEMDALRELARRWPINFAETAFTRCSLCNTPVERVRAAEDAAAEIPPAILERKLPLTRCPTCRRVYWQGGHYARMMAVLRPVFAPDTPIEF